ncbi:hypothetical protein B0H14DRAFT_3454935 [Mycena olivaceomarginata]|nr:hypothetical protein B0H14DRAFT_3454935 [Mycena olivaceomarginata]
MPQFNKTVSQLARPQLLSAATAFGLEASGSVIELRKRLKAYLAQNEDLMDNPDYRPLFSRAQRACFDSYPPAWGGIDSGDTPDPEDANGPNDDSDIAETPRRKPRRN